MTWYSETATLPGVAASTSDRGRSPVFGDADPSENGHGGSLTERWRAARARRDRGPLMRVDLLRVRSGMWRFRVITDRDSAHAVTECPGWHASGLARASCIHVRKMHQLVAAHNEAVRGGSGVRA